MDTHFSIQNAARLLGLSVEEVRKLIRKGLLPSIKLNNQIYVSTNDVQAFREALDSDGAILTPNERMLVMSLKIKSLEARLDKVCKLLDVGTGVSLTVLTDAEMYKMYREACEALSQESWGEGTMHKWCSIFLNITADQFQRLTSLSDNKHPWKVFVDLNKLMKDWWAREGFIDSSPKGREIAYLLDKGFKNLKREAFFFVENNSNDPHLMVLKYFSMPKSDRIRMFLDIAK
jgi:excisionase family DNA binding protein